MSIHVSQTPDFLITLIKVIQLTKSYAFFMSNLKATLEPLSFLLILCIFSWASSILSWIRLPLTKPHGSSDISAGSIVDSLKAMILDITLLAKLHKLIGMNWEK